MKKQVAVCLSLALAGAMCFGLAACDFFGSGSKDNGGNSGNGGNTQTGGSSKQTGTQTQTGKLPEANFEAAWKAAFDEKNFDNFKVTMKLKTIHGKEVLQDGIGTFVVAGKLEHFELTENVSKAKADYYYDGEIFYDKNEEGVWKKVSEVNGTTSDAMLQEMVYSFVDSADEAEYSEEQGGYVVMTSMALPNNGPIIPVTNVFTFKDGRIEKLSIFYSVVASPEESVDYDISYSFIYGGQTVTLPVVSEE